MRLVVRCKVGSEADCDLRVTPSVLAPVHSVLSFLVVSDASTNTPEVTPTLSMVLTPPPWPGMSSTYLPSLTMSDYF